MLDFLERIPLISSGITDPDVVAHIFTSTSSFCEDATQSTLMINIHMRVLTINTQQSTIFFSPIGGPSLDKQTASSSSQQDRPGVLPDDAGLVPPPLKTGLCAVNFYHLSHRNIYLRHAPCYHAHQSETP